MIKEQIKAFGEKFVISIKTLWCVWFGHSLIVDACFGYITCGRCGEQVADNLAGRQSDPNSVVIGHKCKTCKRNYEKLTWYHKIFVPNPF